MRSKVMPWLCKEQRSPRLLSKTRGGVSAGRCHADRLNDLAAFIRQKTDEVRQMKGSATQEVWDKALSSASPYLDKSPDIRQLLDDKKSVFLALGASALSNGKGELSEVMKKVKEVAEVKDEKQRKEKMKGLKEFVLQKAEEAQKKVESLGLGLGGGGGGGGGAAGKVSWNTVEGYVKTLPGGEQMLEKAPQAQALLELSKDKSDEATKLAKETWGEILKVLEDKGKKARALVKEAKEKSK